ncbi:hypothetical protein ACN47E_004663 [Coniothyrium glycines]
MHYHVTVPRAGHASSAGERSLEGRDLEARGSGQHSGQRQCFGTLFHPPPAWPSLEISVALRVSLARPGSLISTSLTLTQDAYRLLTHHIDHRLVVLDPVQRGSQHCIALRSS